MDRKERTQTGKFGPGNKGRPKGTPNKLTRAAKEAFQLAFDQLGGVDKMVEWAQSDPDNLKAFYSLYSKLIPVDVTSGGNAIPTPTFILAHGKPEKDGQGA